ncbi:hypothetical protein [Prosthecomicrobium sp. N25]
MTSIVILGKRVATLRDRIATLALGLVRAVTEADRRSGRPVPQGL